MKEEDHNPGQSVREMLSAFSVERALSNSQARERSPEETAKLMEATHERSLG
jgi:hypothetical protein